MRSRVFWMGALGLLSLVGCSNDSAPLGPRPGLGTATAGSMGVPMPGTGPGAGMAGSAMPPPTNPATNPMAGTTVAPPFTPMMPPPPPKVGATGIQLVRLESNQGAAAVLYQSGAPVPAKKMRAPRVGGRPSFVRGYWKLDMGWQPRVIEAVLTVSYPGGLRREFTDSKMVTSGGPAVGSGKVPLDKAFNWNLMAEDMKVGMEAFVELFEVTPPPGVAPLPGMNPVAPPPRLPTAGALPFHVDDRPAVLKVVIIPTTVGGSTPSSNPDQLEHLRQYLFDIYPVQSVELDLRPPTKFRNTPRRPSDQTPFWAGMERLCRQDKGAAGVIYHAIIDRSKTAMSFGGVAHGVPAKQKKCRVSLTLTNYTSTAGSGVGMGQPTTYTNQIDGKLDTVAHELGHNFGRAHIPCGGPAGADMRFPYKNGSLGQQGYLLNAKEFRHKGEWHDILGYCRPRWISDWQFMHFHKAVKMFTSWGAAAPEALEADPHRSFVGYIAPGNVGSWFEVDGDLAEDDAEVGLDTYAQIWVGGRPSGRLPLTVTRATEGESEKVVFTLPRGVAAPDHATIVIRGVVREIPGLDVERF